MTDRWIKIPIDHIIEDDEDEEYFKEIIKMENEKSFVQRLPIILNINKIATMCRILKNIKFKNLRED